MVTMLRINAAEMLRTFNLILGNHGFLPEKALQCGEIFTGNSVDGVYTHGVNRFARFIQNTDSGLIKPREMPTLKSKSAGIEQWDGQLGPGPLNALHVTDIAMDLARQYGIGCVGLSNTNHWMRGGTYGWKAAKAGFVFIGWTNTISNMPAWGAIDKKIGNNPLVLALPYKEEAIVLDMAMSQFSFGAMELASMKKEMLPVFGGYDQEGQLTKDPDTIIASGRPVPIGFWKGAGLSLLLDILATILSGGLSTSEISKQKTESSLSQVFIAIDLSQLGNYAMIPVLINNIIKDYHESLPVSTHQSVSYPGERVLRTRKKNLEDGIPVLENIWEEILRL